ncbi:MAG: hypothetical protein SF097_13565 [Acidobacteriota bacterium]|nr:hypothetical protein [Acidobacteriota bacterium]
MREVEKLERAYQLAFFILGNREAAEQSAVAAVDRLQVALATQDRRYYYIPQGSSRQLGRSAGARSKISLNELHLLQRLIYDETDTEERAQESAGFDDRRLLIHYLKHLVRITIKRNSFYVSLGVTRFLHRYSITEAMAFYNVLMQDPSRVKDNYYWRSRKGQLLQEIKARFGELLTVTRGAYGEERFIPRPEQTRYADFVSQSLQILMPWETSCPLPTNQAAVAGEIPALRFDADDPDEEHRTEIARIHAALHTDCFQRLLAGLKIEPPPARLDLPEFFHPEMHNHNVQRTSDSFDPFGFMLESNPINKASMRARLEERQTRRRAAERHPQQIRVLVDRQQRALLDLNSNSQAAFTLSEGEEFIEIRDGENLDACLALYPIDYSMLQQAQSIENFVIELAGGQKLRFALTPEHDSFGEVIGAAVTVNSETTQSTTYDWLASWWQNLESAFNSLLWPKHAALALRYGLLAALLIVAGFGTFALWKTLQPEPAEQTAATRNEAGGSQSAKANNGGSLNPNSSPSAVTLPSPQQRTDKTSTLRDPDVTDGATVTVVNSPAQTRKVFLAFNRESEELQTELTNRLKSVQSWELTDKDEADTALDINLSADGQTISIELVNVKGRVIWPRAGKRQKYSGEAAQIAERIVADLQNAIRQSGRTSR